MNGSIFFQIFLEFGVHEVSRTLLLESKKLTGFSRGVSVTYLGTD